MVLWFYVLELPKAQPAGVLVLKRLRRRGNSLKSHPTEWEKPGIEPATLALSLYREWQFQWRCRSDHLGDNCIHNFDRRIYGRKFSFTATRDNLWR